MIRPQRRYTDAERALFAAYRHARSAVRPDACIGEAMRATLAGPDEVGCWVEEGPPALTGNGNTSRCRRCLAHPRTLRRQTADP